MENPAPFFKPNDVEKTELDVKSNATSLFKRTILLIVTVVVILLGIFIVYTTVRENAPDVIIQTQTEYE